MEFQTPLVAANLRRRDKRVLADMVPEGGGAVTAIAPIPARCRGWQRPG